MAVVEYLTAACKWLLKMGTIDENDEKFIIYLRKTRNNIAHEFVSLLLYAYDNGFDDPTEDNIQSIIALYYKINQWWVYEIEGTTNPYYIELDIEELKNVQFLPCACLYDLYDKISAI